MTDGYVYFIQATRCRLIKIGYSADPVRRFRNLQTANPEPLQPLGIIAGTIEDEWDLHERFHNDRVHGEWFEPSLALRSHIRTLFPDAKIATEALPLAVVPKPEFVCCMAAAARFGVSAATIRRWFTRGLVGRLKINGVALYRVSDIDDLIAARETRRTIVPMLPAAASTTLTEASEQDWRTLEFWRKAR
jgi:hypothetical protein